MQITSLQMHAYSLFHFRINIHCNQIFSYHSQNYFSLSILRMLSSTSFQPSIIIRSLILLPPPKKRRKNLTYLSASSRTNHSTLDRDKQSVCCMWSRRRPGVPISMLIPLRILEQSTTKLFMNSIIL